MDSLTIGTQLEALKPEIENRSMKTNATELGVESHRETHLFAKVSDAKAMEKALATVASLGGDAPLHSPAEQGGAPWHVFLARDARELSREMKLRKCEQVMEKAPLPPL